MTSFDELRTDLLALCAQIEEHARAQDAPGVAHDMADAARRLAEGKLRVAFIGEFKRGKSTLINVLLDREPPLLPVGRSPRTRMIIRVEYGAEEAYFLTDKSGHSIRISRADIDKYAAEPEDAAAANKAEALQVVIQLPHEKLRSGLVLLDTPGVGGIYAAHDAVTDDALAEADAILFVAGLSEPLSDGELQFLERAGDAVRARETRDAMLIAFNQIDSRPSYHEELKKCRADALHRTGLLDSELPVLPVSGKSKQLYLKHDDPAFLKKSGIPELEAELWSRLLRRRIRVLLGDAVDRAGRSADRIIGPLQTAENGLRRNSGEELLRIAREIRDGRARLATLESEGAAWRQEIASRLEDLRDQMIARCEQECAAIWQRAETDYLRDQYYLIDPSRLGPQINGRFRSQLHGVDEWAAREAGRVQRDCAVRWQLESPDASIGAIAGVSILDLPDFDVLQERIRTVTRTKPVTRVRVGEDKISRGSGRKANVLQRGFVTAMSLFGDGSKRWAADFAGVELVPRYETYGGETYAEEISEGYAQNDLNRRRKELQDILRAAQDRSGDLIRQSVAQQVTTMSAAIALEMERQIKLEDETLRRTLPLLAVQQTETREQADARLAELAETMRPIKRLRKLVQVLEKDVSGLIADAA
ncbi:MAG TPA: dynamin family protein [Trebonia sp.]|nr:dynamin family protein [Trebonia sp.]